ncbi:MAG: hypothetical protein KDB27_28165, partial [Planctomycetales bacterium]|nr:hypothetical protein [Planctomycetales bacterium]
HRGATGDQHVGMWGFSGTIQGAKMTGIQRFWADGSYESVVVTIENRQAQKIEEKGTFVDRGTFFEFKTNEGHYRQNYKMHLGKLVMEFPELNTWIEFNRIPVVSNRNSSQDDSSAAASSKLQGTWQYEGIEGNDYFRLTITLAPQSEYRCLIQDLSRHDGSVTAETSSKGTWSADDQHVVISTPNNGGNRKASYKFESGKLILNMDGNVRPFVPVEG